MLPPSSVATRLRAVVQVRKRAGCAPQSCPKKEKPTPDRCTGTFRIRGRLVKILERPAGQQFAPFQGLLESGIAVGYVFFPGAQFVACSSPRSRFKPAVRTPGGPVARHPQPRGRKPVLRREIPWILRGFQGRLSCWFMVYFKRAEFWHRRCSHCLLLVMCTHPIAKEALTLHLARSEGHKRYFGCNLMHRNVLALSHQHLMAEAPRIPANPHYCPKSSKMLKAPDVLRSIQKAPFAASHPIDEFGHPRPTA